MAKDHEPNIEVRALIALVISLVILAIWQYFFAPEAPQPGPPEEALEQPLRPEQQQAEPVEREEEPPPVAEEAQREATQADAEESIVVQTETMTVELTNRGGRIRSIVLEGYEGDFGGPLELVVGDFEAVGELPLGLSTPMAPGAATAANEALYQMTVEGGSSVTGAYRAERGPLTVRWLWDDGASWRVEKSLTFNPAGYLLHTSARVEAAQGTPFFLNVGPSLQDQIDPSTRSFYLTRGGVALTAEGVEHWAFDDLEQDLALNGRVAWGGVESAYFLALFVPGGDSVLQLRSVPWPPAVAQTGQASEPSAPSGSSAAEESRTAGVQVGIFIPETGLDVPFYLGPKKHDVLAATGNRLQEAVDFGMFGFLAYPLLVGLNWIYGYVGNYGVAIIALTVLIKILFLPLTHRSMISMRKMQKLQPEMQAIRARYKGVKDMQKRQEMNNEIMGLYKKHGVSPLGGCFPLLLQMPVLFAFYACLSVAIEIRQAPFMLWITDLSEFDPWYVLPVAMGASMYVQQRMTPTTVDPAQARIFRLMPIMFTFIFLGLPSGLVLYWLVNNLLGIAQQVYINRQVDAAVASEAAPSKPKGSKGKANQAGKRKGKKRGKR